MLMGLLECGREEWGAHPGQVCAGPEVSLETISQGVPLAGWWRMVESERESLGPTENDHLLIDETWHPRAWAQSGGPAYEKFKRHRNEWAFGCASYLDHPLVVGQENRASDGVRSTFPSPGCDGDPELHEPRSRRFLEWVNQEGGMLCFRYEQLTFKDNSAHRDSDHRERRHRLCFGYDAARDQVRVASGAGSKPLLEHRYARYVPGNDGEPSARQSMQGAWGSGDVSTLGSGPAKEGTGAWR